MVRLSLSRIFCIQMVSSLPKFYKGWNVHREASSLLILCHITIWINSFLLYFNFYVSCNIQAFIDKSNAERVYSWGRLGSLNKRKQIEFISFWKLLSSALASAWSTYHGKWEHMNKHDRPLNRFHKPARVLFYHMPNSKFQEMIHFTLRLQHSALWL